MEMWIHALGVTVWIVGIGISLLLFLILTVLVIAHWGVLSSIFSLLPWMVLGVGVLVVALLIRLSLKW